MNGPKKAPRYGHRAGHRIFRWVILHFGVGPAYAVLVPVIGYYVLFRPSAVRAAAPYIRRRFSGRGRWGRLRLTYRHYYQFGLCLVDQAAAGLLGSESLRIEFPDAEVLRRLSDEGRGLVFITSHVGIWQRAISVLGFMGRTVYLHLRRDATSESMGLAAFGKPGPRIVSPDDFLGGIPELSSALAHGNIVAVMGDRGFGSATCARVGFLGDDAPFPLLPYHLALTTNSDIVVFLTSRIGRMRIRLRADVIRMTPDCRVLDKEEARMRLLRCYAGLLEDHLREHPLMWFNFFDFWAG
jgi:predicted LPLAT superfamily acyltransferase